MTADEILDELHQIREELMAKYRGKPDEVFIRDLEERATKVYAELGLQPAEDPWASKQPEAPKAKS